MSKKILFLIFILLEISIVSAININEIMYNPIGSDDKKEFIEIYMDTPINLDGYIISDGDSNDTLKINRTFNSNYALILEDNYQIDMPQNVSVYTIGAAIGNGLSSDDIISLYDKNKNLVSQITSFEIQEGYSLEFYEGKLYQSLIINGTPGYKNSIINIEQDFSKLKISEFFPDPIGEDNAPMPNGEFIEIYNPSSNNIDLNGLKLKDNTNHTIIISDMNTISDTIIQPNSYLAIFMNGFYGFLNNDGLELIKLYDLNNNLIDELTYAFSEEGLTWSKVNNFWQLRMPSPNEENKANEPLYKSNLKIENIYIGTDEKAKFGDNLRIRIKAYKGNTSKETIKIYATTLKDEAISKQTTANLINKFTNYTLTLPIQLEPNCKQKYPDGIYKIILEGLNANASEEIKIEGITNSLCQKVKENITKEIHYEILSMPGNLKVGEPITYEIKILNDENQKTEFEAWSYISKGTKIITGEEKANIQKLDLPAGSSATLSLENNLEEATETGEYTVKIKLLKENRVRPIVIDSKINIQGDEIQQQDKIPQETNSGTGETVYLSTSQRAKFSAIYFFVALLLLITVVLIIKKTN